jgi:hypothetical protein
MELFFFLKFQSNSLVWTIDIVNGENGQVAVIAEIAQSDTAAGLEVELLHSLSRNIESNGHGEKVAIGEARISNDTVGN